MSPRAEEDPEQLSSELDREAEDLERRSRDLESDISEARSDWERKRADESIAGAPPKRGEGAEQDKDAEEDKGERVSQDTPPAKD